jgi:hypothetical protein
LFWGPQLVAAIGGAIGVGAVAMSPIAVRSSRLRATALTVVFIAFVAAAVVIDRPSSLHGVLLDLFAVLIVGVALALAYEHVNGLEQLARLFTDGDAGYAVVLDERTASRTVDSELARSRRHNIPLTFLVLRAPGVAHPPAFERTVARVSSRALAELERRYVRGRTCELIAERVRRSDLVVCSADGHFLVIASDTTAEGTVAVAGRIIDAVNAELDVELHAGVAAFPSDGTTYGDLLASAFAGTDERDEDHDQDRSESMTVGALELEPKVAASGLPSVPQVRVNP